MYYCRKVGCLPTMTILRCLLLPPTELYFRRRVGVLSQTNDCDSFDALSNVDALLPQGVVPPWSSLPPPGGVTPGSSLLPQGGVTPGSAPPPQGGAPPGSALPPQGGTHPQTFVYNQFNMNDGLSLIHI